MKEGQSAAKLINKEFGVLTVIGFSHRKGRHSFIKCKCQCGNFTTVRQDKLVLGDKSPKSCIYCRGNNVKPTIDAPRNVLKYHYTYGATVRNLSFDLSDQEFDNLIFENCYYCGQPPSIYQCDIRYNKTDNKFLRNGIDRIDSTKGYNKDNCVSCCDICNKMKINIPLNIFLEKIKLINNCLLKRSTTIPEGSTLQVNGSGNRGLLNSEEKEGDIVYSV